MGWKCGRCGRPAKIVFTCKVAENFNVFVGDACTQCVREMAESAVSIEKMDMIHEDLGYTKAALEEGVLQLMKCPMCKKWRGEILMIKPDEMCASCFNYFMYAGRQTYQ
jgi:hypothetical protein